MKTNQNDFESHGNVPKAYTNYSVSDFIKAIVPAFFFPLVIFRIRFGEISSLAWGLSVFFSVYCLLMAVGTHFNDKKEFHSNVAAKGDLVDVFGSCWLLFCLFGPFFGWILGQVVSLTEETWRPVYATRFMLAGVFPILSSIALARYVKGSKVPWIPMAILVLVTSLPVMSVANFARDLFSSPINDGETITLKYTQAEFSVEQWHGFEAD